LDGNFNESKETFICKLNNSGSDLVYSTFFGGSKGLYSGKDYIYDIAVDEKGNAYVIGNTLSPNFTLTEQCIDDTYTHYDGFLSIIDPQGNKLLYSTFLYSISPRSVAVDSPGDVYITGDVYEFPATPGSYNSTVKGASDAFVCKISPVRNELEYFSIIGGSEPYSYKDYSDHDLALGISIDDQGCVYITGITNTIDFPITPNAYDSSYNGGYYDVFVCKFNTSGSELLYSTYLGGDWNDYADGLIVDTLGNIYVSGRTQSSNFPKTEGFYRDLGSGNFVYKFSLENASLVNENRPNKFFLNPSYPNPFNLSTTITFTLPLSGFASLVIYNVMGQEVRELVSDTMTTGLHSVTWDGKDNRSEPVSSGIYFSRLTIGNHAAAGRMLLLK